MHVYLPGPLISAVADEYRRVGQPTDTARLSALAFRDETIAIQVSALLLACRAGKPDLYAAGAAGWLVKLLLSQQAEWRHVADDPRLTAAISDQRLARVIEFMSGHLDHTLTLRDLAREAGISVHHFGRRFRERTGMGPSAYLTTLRIEQARVLLTTTDLAIADISLRCGYSRPSAFFDSVSAALGCDTKSVACRPLGAWCSKLRRTCHLRRCLAERHLSRRGARLPGASAP